MSECWLWAKSKGNGGYGRILNGKQAHRIIYEALVGEIPKGMFVCHSCDTPPCINPEHLFLGTAKDNTADMLIKGRGNWNMGKHNLVKTHCPKGHEYSPENTYKRNDGRRDCRTCHRAMRRRQNARKYATA